MTYIPRRGMTVSIGAIAVSGTDDGHLVLSFDPRDKPVILTADAADALYEAIAAVMVLA